MSELVVEPVIADPRKCRADSPGRTRPHHPLSGRRRGPRHAQAHPASEPCARQQTPKHEPTVALKKQATNGQLQNTPVRSKTFSA
ncbi:MAG: hypothetical protein R3A10_07335 [Caldilineaceae bacterium]